MSWSARFSVRRSAWRTEALRTNLWLVPTIEVVAAVVLFAITYRIDQAAYHGDITLPSWVNNGSADAARQILTAIAAAVITVVGLVFSITIVALTLTSTQFGPRMLRNFIRDRGTQVTLGTFVATFVYAVLSLGSISHGDRGDFVPHLSITVALALVLASLCVLIYFIHHVATVDPATRGDRQHRARPRGRDRGRGDRIGARDGAGVRPVEAGPSVVELRHRMEEAGAVVVAPTTGYLQFVGLRRLHRHRRRDRTQSSSSCTVPATSWCRVFPSRPCGRRSAAEAIGRRLEQAHFTGPNRTLAQDLTFAIDQLVEIAIRALSPAVNDTFTALTCIDWLSDGLCKISSQWNPTLVHRDRPGNVRVIAADVRYNRFVERAFDKIRQASRGMPAVMIRQLDALAKIMAYTTTDEQRRCLLEQAEMIQRASTESVPEPGDRADVDGRYEAVISVAAAVTDGRLAEATRSSPRRTTSPSRWGRLSAGGE